MGSPTLPDVRAVQFDLADPKFPASLVDVPEPELPGASWTRVSVTGGGVCGSDLHLFTQNVGPSPTLASLASIPFLLGHEIAGRVIESGSSSSHPVGTRVAVDPCIPCAPRGIDPPCARTAPADGLPRVSTSTAECSPTGDHSGTRRTLAAGGPIRSLPTIRCSTRFRTRCPTRWPASTSPSRSPPTGCCARRRPRAIRSSSSVRASSGWLLWPRSRVSSRPAE